MPSYAILGGTGSTGSKIIQNLLRNPDNHVNIYVRSRSKLEGIIPGVTSNAQASIFEGVLTDVSLIASCLFGTAAVFATVASNVNAPGTRIAQDSAQIIVAAMMQLKFRNPDVHLPRIIMLSSASVNPNAPPKALWAVRMVVHTAFKNIYDDLKFAQAYLELHKDWLEAVFVTPGALTEGPEIGHRLSLTDPGKFLGYADLAAGMVEVAESGEYSWKMVCVVAADGRGPFKKDLLYYLLQGLSFYLVPSLYSLLHHFGII